MNRFFYTIFLTLLSPLILLYLAYRAYKSVDYRGRVSERFGLKRLRPTKPVLLIHCVSVGETLAAVPLINGLIERYPTYQIVVTTSTPTGSQAVVKAFAERVLHCYLPIDLPGAIKRFLNDLQPQVCIVMETELWPNLIHQLHQRNVPTLLANARMSAKSQRGYLKNAAPLMREMLQKLHHVAAQFDSDGERFIALGLAPEKLEIAGSIKFDINIAPQLIIRQQALKQQWASHRPVWVAGSTHPIEHQQILNCHQQLLNTFPDLLLIIVPRHSERFDEVVLECQKMDFNVIRRSAGIMTNSDTQIIVGDSMGELLLFFGLADIAFIGGSLIERGGHNPLEPAALGKPLVMGSSVYNFSDICDKLIASDALTLVSDEQQLTQHIIQLLQHPEKMAQQGANALQLMRDNQGTLQRLMRWVDDQLTD
ncbi:MAG: lipid IV(A) 3-deoxy-D-manno-octulosonic acid transferase [Psychrobium sp.]|nr:lipid IV(A) 3-deoxy-D-manno-octulosonic acid transferase [Psychrobium sp.]